MKSLAVLSLLLLLATSAPFHYENVEEWNSWKTQHRKEYSSDLEELERHLVWLSNKQYIDAHNANEDIMGFRLAMNTFGDMVRKIIIMLFLLFAKVCVYASHSSQTDAEYISQYNGFHQSRNRTHMKPKPFKPVLHYNESYLPRSLDWRTKGAVSRVKKQVHLNNI